MSMASPEQVKRKVNSPGRQELLLPHQLETWPDLKRTLMLSLTGQSFPFLPDSVPNFGGILGDFDRSMYEFIIEQALDIETLFVEPIFRLCKGETRELMISQRQALCLNSHAFLNTFPPVAATSNVRRMTFISYLNFRQVEKIRFLFIYFDTCRSILASHRQWQGANISFSRCAIDISPSQKMDWLSSPALLTSMTIDESMLNEESGNLHALFSSEFVGNGVLMGESMQEEIKFLTCPECFLSVLFAESLNPNEALLLRGMHKFAQHAGVGTNFRFVSACRIDVFLDIEYCKDSFVVAMDAIPFPGSVIMLE